MLKQKYMKTVKLRSIAVITAVALSACGGDKTETTTSTVDTTTVAAVKDTTPVTVDDVKKFKFDFAIANIPSPVQLMNDIAAEGGTYNNSIMHDTKRAANYKTEFSKAVNLGIYDLDMGYAIAHEKGEDMMKYFKASVTEGEALGLKSIFGEMVGRRAENNMDNKDSLLRIIDEIYVKGDDYLRTNDRVQTATHIFIGSWVEAIYIVCKQAEVENDAAKKGKMYKQLWDQRFYLKNLVDLLSEFKDKKDNAWLMDELNKIHAEINAIKDAKEIDEAKFKSIAAKVYALRSALTNK
jgi:hypothetical protein